jgi:hypothetical protein
MLLAVECIIDTYCGYYVVFLKIVTVKIVIVFSTSREIIWVCVTMACWVLRLQMEKTASRYGGSCEYIE